jgi:hypothetical protein
MSPIDTNKHPMPGSTSGPVLNHGQTPIVVNADNTVTVGASGPQLLDGILPMKADTDNVVKVNGVPILHGNLKIFSA